MTVITWQIVQDAIVAAMAAASGLDQSRILWAFQPIGEPQLDDPIDGGGGNTTYLKLSLPTILKLGQDWVQTTYDGTRPAGQEIAAQPTGFRELPLELQVFTSSTADGNAAIFVAEQIGTAMILPSIADPLAAVGVTVFDPGPVNYAPSVVGANFRGRATCTLRMYAPAIAVAQLYGYIAEAAGTLSLTGGKQSPVEVPFDVPFDKPNDGT
jgi:hypothetical protein